MSQSSGMSLSGTLSSLSGSGKKALTKISPAMPRSSTRQRKGDGRSRKSARESSTRIRMHILDKASASETADNILKIKSQKLLRAVIILIGFFGFGVTFYSLWEGMEAYEALYFTILTISTVGYGDHVPSTDVGKLVTCVFVFAGLALIAEAMGIIGDYMLERVNRISQQVAEEAARRQKEAALKKQREEQVADAETNLKIMIEKRNKDRSPGGRGHGRGSVHGVTTLSKDAIDKYNKERAISSSGSSLPIQSSRSGRATALNTLVSGMVAVNKVRTKTFTMAVNATQRGTGRISKRNSKKGGPKGLESEYSNSPLSSDEKTDESGTPQKPMRNSLSKKEMDEQLALEEEEHELEEAMKRRWHLVWSVLYIALAVASGTIFFAVAEGFNWVDALYLSCITVTSVGYGDKKPETRNGKIFAMFWILLGTFLVAKAIGGYLDYQTKIKQQEIRKRILAKPLTMSEIEQADIDDSKSLSEAEFVLYKLQAMGILSRTDVEKVNRKFRVELNPGEDGEVQIPPKEHVEQCYKDGQDFYFAMRSYQDKISEDEKEKKEEVRKGEAKSSLSKRKLGLYAGALNKLRRTIKEGAAEGLKDRLIELLDNDDIVADLPEVENDDDEIEREIKEIIFSEAKDKLKTIQDEQNGGIDKAGGIMRTNTSVQNAAASLIAKLKSRRGRESKVKSPSPTFGSPTSTSKLGERLSNAVT
ncbi:hypothetical protein TrLO_g12334 [Triparma laevis f. longispina]|uniref:Potassium channel domain-containing protein n=1 Tax=Triparma laevis f. longispina TaxID=1714387 RepID=A0A9W7FUS9_9STRA|nr:hypothetical protein TrLO_g12334 [Triparma laevis f. longispina]